VQHARFKRKGGGKGKRDVGREGEYKGVRTVKGGTKVGGKNGCPACGAALQSHSGRRKRMERKWWELR